MILSILKAVISKIFCSAYSYSYRKDIWFGIKITWVKIIQPTPNSELLAAYSHMVLLPASEIQTWTHFLLSPFLITHPSSSSLSLYYYCYLVTQAGQVGNTLHLSVFLNFIHTGIICLSLSILGSWLRIYCSFTQDFPKQNLLEEVPLHLQGLLGCHCPWIE